MAKEFDIYLRNRLVECDLLVYSIPYRDGISAANRMILEAALNGYLLHMALAAQMGIEMASHIDKMIKLCIEKLSMGVGLGASVDFKSHSTFSAEASPIIIDTTVKSAMERTFNALDNGLVLAVQPLVTQSSTSTGRRDLPLLVDSDITGTLKRSLLNLRNAAIPEAAIKQFSQADYLNMDSPMAIDAALQNLCYQLSFDASAAVEIVALVLGTEISHSLGRWYNGLVLNSCVAGTAAQKFITAQSIVTILQEATAKLQMILYPEETLVILGVPNLDVVKRRYRLLGEMDHDTLSAYDGMSLDDVDYVIL